MKKATITTMITEKRRLTKIRLCMSRNKIISKTADKILLNYKMVYRLLNLNKRLLI